jgi:hypothetical protein
MGSLWMMEREVGEGRKSCGGYEKADWRRKDTNLSKMQKKRENTPVILATWEADIRRIEVQSQPQANS